MLMLILFIAIGVICISGIAVFFKDMIFEMMLESRTKSKDDRIAIYKHLQKKVDETYREQTYAGNYYNALIEFNMGSDNFRKLKDRPENLKSLAYSAIDDSIKYL